MKRPTCRSEWVVIWWQGRSCASRAIPPGPVMLSSRSGGIEADLEVSIRKAQQFGVRDNEITPGFEQKEGQILGGAPAVGEDFLEQVAFFHQLEQGIGQLQE